MLDIWPLYVMRILHLWDINAKRFQIFNADDRRANRLWSSSGEVQVSTGLAFWLIMATGGAVLIGVALAYGLIIRRRRAREPRA